MSVKARMGDIFSGLHEAPHDFNISLTVFHELNIDKAKSTLRLEERAKARAHKNEPELESTSLDAVEYEVIEFVETAKNRNRKTLVDQLEVYAERLAALNFEGRLGDIDIGIQEAKAEFLQIIQLGLDQLHALRRSLLHREKDLEHFREDNKLRRAADYPSLPKKIFLIGIIAVIGLIETFGNTAFLAKGNELGILGAYTEALVISALNIGGAIIFAQWSRNIVHNSTKRVFIGYLAAVSYLVFMLGLNILVAHYREVSGIFIENGGIEAINRLKADLLGLVDFQSWILLGMGCLFSIVSFWDALKFDDIYPGYGKKTRILEVDRHKYIDEKEFHISELAQHLKDTVEGLRSTKYDLIKWRQEHTSIMESRKRLLEAFDEQMTHLQHAADTLLTSYRETNRKARGGVAPGRFKKPWKMTIPQVDRAIPASALNVETMNHLIAQLSGKLEAGMSSLHDQHNIGLQNFRGLDDLVEDEKLGKDKNDKSS